MGSLVVYEIHTVGNKMAFTSYVRIVFIKEVSFCIAINRKRYTYKTTVINCNPVVTIFRNCQFVIVIHGIKGVFTSIGGIKILTFTGIGAYP